MAYPPQGHMYPPSDSHGQAAAVNPYGAQPGGYPPQMGGTYPPPGVPGGPPGGYPPQGASDAYPPQGAPGGYPPPGGVHGGYPPQGAPGYPPQAGYPPPGAHGGFPPQQGGYPPQQGGYPPQGVGHSLRADEEWVVEGPGGYQHVISHEEAMAAGGEGAMYQREVEENGEAQSRGLGSMLIAGKFGKKGMAMLLLKGLIKKRKKKFF